MLKDDRKQSVGLKRQRFSPQVLTRQPDVRGPRHAFPDMRKAQTAFRDGRSSTSRLDHRIDHDQLLSSSLRGIGHEELNAFSDLGRGKPDPVVGVHRVDHIARKPPYVV